MILDRIVADNLQGLENQKRNLPQPELERLIASQTAPLDFATALRGNNIRLIAEIKKASPSKGVIRTDFDPIAIARDYASGGASAISVLTEEKHFQGKLEYISIVKAATGGKMPVLRKDFIYDPYQVYESRANGADALLLIAAMLTKDKLNELLKISHGLGMDCLVEVHNEAELNIVLDSDAGIIGINNRDLKTFKVDPATTEKLRPLILKDKVVVSESGIHSHEDIVKLHKIGIDAVLIGEAFMTAQNIAVKVREIMGS